MAVDERPDTSPSPLCDGEREFWMQVRQGLIIQLAAVEKRLGLAPSRPRRERAEKIRAWKNEDEAQYRTA